MQYTTVTVIMIFLWHNQLLSSLYISLFMSSSKGNLDVVTFLVTTGNADVNSKDKNGDTPLNLAC